MPIYTFNWQGQQAQSPGAEHLTDLRFSPKVDGVLKTKNASPFTHLIPSTKDRDKSSTLFFENQNINIAEDVKEILPRGLETMDRGIKNYFQGIRIPTKDGYHLMGVRLTGGDKSLLIWAQDLKRGRVQLPALSISRSSVVFDETRFSYAHHPMTTRFSNSEGSLITKTFRPWPCKIDYSLIIWAAHKRDLEYAAYQIMTRFNPIAEFPVEDEHLSGGVLVKFTGFNDDIDDEVGSEDRQNKRYEISLEMEGWLPLPEVVVPSILGRVTSLRESNGSVLR